MWIIVVQIMMNKIIINQENIRIHVIIISNKNNIDLIKDHKEKKILILH